MRKAAGNYKYDPTHTHKPKEGRWDKTDRGWSRRLPPSQEETGAASSSARSFALVALPPPSKPLRKRLVVFARSKFRGFFSGGMARLEEASAEVDNIVGDQRAKNPDLNHLIRCYADHKMPRVVPGLSAHLSRFFGLNNTATDFRTKGIENLPPSPPELLSRLGDLLSYEQAVIRAAGLVRKDGTVTLFRSCGKEQLGKSTVRSTKYSGSNIESWSLRPNLKWKGKKVMANIPLKYCIASCIGRKDRPFMHPKQSEIVVCGSFIKRVRMVDKRNPRELMGTTVRALRSNMLAWLSEGKKASRNAARCGNALRMRIGKALLSVASEVLRGKVGHDGLYYGKRFIHGKRGDWAAQRRTTMPRKRKKALRVEDDPLLYYMRKTGSIGDAIELADKWEKAHGIEPEGPPINTNTPAEDAYLAQMRRWTGFVTAHGHDIGEMSDAVCRRLWREFIAEEHARDPSIPISEWDD